MRLLLTVIFLISFPLISANAFEVKNCSIKPRLTTRDMDLFLELNYTATIVNNTKKCVDMASIDFKVENANILNHSGNMLMYACPGTSGNFNKWHSLIVKKKIKLENYDSELQLVNKEYEKIKKDITSNKIICEWNPH